MGQQGGAPYPRLANRELVPTISPSPSVRGFGQSHRAAEHKTNSKRSRTAEGTQCADHSKLQELVSDNSDLPVRARGPSHSASGVTCVC